MQTGELENETKYLHLNANPDLLFKNTGVIGMENNVKFFGRNRLMLIHFSNNLSFTRFDLHEYLRGIHYQYFC